VLRRRDRRRARLRHALPTVPLGRLALGALRLVNQVVPERDALAVLVGIPDVEDGMIALADELLARGREVVLLIAGTRVADGFHDPRVRTIPRRDPRAVWAYLRARDVFTTHGVYGERGGPARQRLTYVWHGESTGKRIDRYLDAPAKPRSTAPVCSTVGQAFRCAEFGLAPRSVPVVGAPRNDRLLRAPRCPHPLFTERARARCRLLWMPTYRAGAVGHRRRTDSTRGHAGLPFDREELVELDHRLAELDVAVHVKLHPFAADAFDLRTRALVPLSDADLWGAGLTTYTALPRVDGLITDVSSVWIDHLLLDRPVVVAFPDLEEYRATRGFALEPFEDWMPAPVTRTVDDLVDEIAAVAAGDDPHAARRRARRALLHEHGDDRSAARLLDVLGAG
jgi:CDP-glycerol glycerophosphotransferase